MSFTLTLAYHIRQDLKTPPVEKGQLEFFRNYQNRSCDGYQYDICQGPLVDLLTRDIDCLKKAIDPALFSKVVNIIESPEEIFGKEKITHDPVIMLAVANELKSKVEPEGEAFLNRIGLDTRPNAEVTIKVLLAELELFSIFCEFGIANGLRFYHLYL